MEAGITEDIHDELVVDNNYDMCDSENGDAVDTESDDEMVVGSDGDMEYDSDSDGDMEDDSDIDDVGVDSGGGSSDRAQEGVCLSVGVV